VSVDAARLNLIAYGGEGFGTPLFPETLDRVLDATDLRPGDRALDLGCGHGQMALRLARRGMIVEAVERHAIVAEAACLRTADAAPGSVTVHVGDAGRFLDQSAPARLVSAVGAGGLAGGRAEPAAVLARLASAVEPGGWLSWGETFWRTPPSPRLQLTADVSGAYRGHADYVRAGVEAGLTPMAAVESSRAEWDDYVFRYVAAVERHAAAHPADPDTPALVDRARAWRDLYLDEAREVMGFGLYLFWKA